MSQADLQTAWVATMKELDSKYETLDAGFLEVVRQVVERCYQPLFGAATVQTGGKVKKEKAPRGVTAYNLFIKEFTAAHKTAEPVMGADGKPVSAFTQAAAAWKTATAATKADYTQRAAEQNTADGIVKVGDKPKKAMNGYNLFIQDYCSAHSGEEGNFQAAAGAWKVLDEAGKQPFKERAAALKAGLPDPGAPQPVVAAVKAAPQAAKTAAAGKTSPAKKEAATRKPATTKVVKA